MICTSVWLSPRVVNPVGLVEPVELRGIRPAQVELRRGTGGTGVGVAFCRRITMVPPVTPTGTTKNRQKGLQYHRFHQSPLPHDGSFTGLKTILAKRLESIS